MKIYLNRQPVNQPWGGGNRFITKLHTTLLERGHDVTFELEPCDVYICFDPRHNDKGVCGTDIVNASKKNRGKLICRVGDLGTHGKPELLRQWMLTVLPADVIVFPSQWAEDYLIRESTNIDLSWANSIINACERKGHIIRNGALKSFFDNRRGNLRFNGIIKVVSHHWSNSMMKGFELYEKLDAIEGIEFTYIGRKPDSINLKNHIEPLSVEQLVLELPKHDVYFTASQAEAGANHVLEAMAAGLPVVYSAHGGSIVEYVNDRGECYKHNFNDAIRAIFDCWTAYYDKHSATLKFNRTVDMAVEEFIALL